MVKQEIYTCSATKEEIPLSFTGRHLLQNLREAIINWDRHGWTQLSLARAALASYMSKLERKDSLREASIEELLEEIGNRMKQMRKQYDFARGDLNKQYDAGMEAHGGEGVARSTPPPLSVKDTYDLRRQV